MPIRVVLFIALLVCPSATLTAAEIAVMSSGGFTAAYKQLVPLYEKATGDRVVTVYGASIGEARDSIPSRLNRGEPADVVILAANGLEALVRQGHAVPGSRTDLGLSTIGMVVRKGAAKPDISTVEALTRTLLEADSIAYSASASGTYLSTKLFQRLGVADRVMPKAKRILSERVAAVVARGEAQIGFQQISELLPVPGVDFVGPLPKEVQQVTPFSAGIASRSTQPEAARRLIDFLSAPEAAPIVAKTGLEPVIRRR